MKEELGKPHLAEARVGGLRRRVAALQIIVCRLIQAIGGAFVFADAAAILTGAFPPDQRDTAMGISGAARRYRALKEMSAHNRNERFDPLGAGTFSLGLVPLLIALLLGIEYSWPSLPIVSTHMPAG